MNPRLEKALAGLQGGLQKLKWPVLVAVASVVLGVVAAALFVATRPLPEYARALTSTLEESLPAHKVSVASLQWRFGLLDLSVGLAAKDLRIEDAQAIEHAEWKEIKVAVQPLKLLLGKVPLRIEGKGGKVALRRPAGLDARSPQVGVAPAARENQELFNMPKWLAHLRVDAKFAFEELSYGIEYKAQETVLKASLVGLPGHFTASLESELRVNSQSPELDARGPAKAKLGGFFQLEHGKPVGLRINGVEVDLDEATITGLGLVEKSAGIPLSLRANVQALFDEKAQLAGVEIEDAGLDLDKIHLTFGASWEAGGKRSVKWNAGRTECVDLRLPLVGLREIPMQGLFETNGELNFSQSELISGNWKIAINNMRFNPSARSEASAAKGKLSLSFMNEGMIENGHISSPHAELQVDGTDAEINVFGGKFMKPAGKALSLIAKASLKNDQLDLSEVRAVFHALQIDGRARLDGLSSYLSGKPASYQIMIQSNRVDLSQYSTFLPLFRKPPPLEGFLEVAGEIEGNNLGAEGFKVDDAKWRIDRLNLTNLRGVMDRESFVRFGFEDKNYSLMGPFQVSFLFRGRGQGTVVDRAMLMSQLDLTNTALIYKDSFRKPAGIPLSLDLSAEQARQALQIRKGLLRFHDLELNLDGRIVQGSARSFIDLRMPRPILLSNWKPLLLSAGNLPLDGRVQWKGRMGFRSPGSMESSLDWRTLSIEGLLELSDITGRFGDLKSAVRHGRGKIELTPDTVTLPSFSIEMGGTKIAASGKLRFPDTKRTQRGNLSRLLSGEGWDIDAALSMSRVNPEDFASTQPEGAPRPPENIRTVEGPTLGQKLKAWLESPFARTSSAKLSFRAGTGAWNGLSATDINARAIWNHGMLQLQPLGLRMFDGQVSGSATWDAARYYARGDNPELTTSLKVDGVELGRVVTWFKPDMAKLLSGKFSGQLTSAMVGFESEELKRTMKGRLQGKVNDGSFETLQVLQGALDSLMRSSEAKDFLMAQASRESCFRKRFSGDVDVQVGSEGLDIQRGGLNFETGSSIEVSGKLTSDLMVSLRGSFIAGPSCIKGDARACLAGTDGKAAIPFQIGGRADKPEAKVEIEAIGRKIASCVVNAAKKRAESEVRKQLASPAVQEGLKGIEQKAKDALKGVFKR